MFWVGYLLGKMTTCLLMLSIALKFDKKKTKTSLFITTLIIILIMGVVEGIGNLDGRLITPHLFFSLFINSVISSTICYLILVPLVGYKKWYNNRWFSKGVFGAACIFYGIFWGLGIPSALIEQYQLYQFIKEVKQTSSDNLWDNNKYDLREELDYASLFQDIYNWHRKVMAWDGDSFNGEIRAALDYGHMNLSVVKKKVIDNIRKDKERTADSAKKAISPLLEAAKYTMPEHAGQINGFIYFLILEPQINLDGKEYKGIEKEAVYTAARIVLTRVNPAAVYPKAYACVEQKLGNIEMSVPQPNWLDTVSECLQDYTKEVEKEIFKVLPEIQERRAAEKQKMSTEQE